MLLCQQWHCVMDVYVPMIEKLRQHDDFTDADIRDFHLKRNAFMSEWVDLVGGKGVTNYIHMLGAGHVTYYLKQYRNLYQLSQQGWEAMNQKLKHFYLTIPTIVAVVATKMVIW
jgi:hypothetical protein